MKRDLRDRRIVLTGASSGIGRSLSEQLARAGAKLALVARSADKLHDLAQQLGRHTEVFALPTDITREADRQRLLEAVTQRWGGLDILINNAGVASWAHFAESTEAIMREVMEVNFFAPIELTRLFVPLLTQGRQAAVLSVSSMCGRRGMPAWPEYSASKHGLVGMMESLRGELARFDISVLTVLPGLTRSSLHSTLLKQEGRAKIDFTKGMEPMQVATAIVQALHSNRFETVVGADAKWMLRVQRFFPRLVDWLIARRVKQLYATT